MRRGYSLPLVLLVLSTLSLAMLALSVVATASARSTGAVLQRRQALYACDGVVRALSVKSRDYFATTSAPTAATLRQALCGNAAGPTCPDATGWMPGFTVEEVAVDTGATNEIGEIANGPFAGQMARRTDLALRVELLHTTGRRCRVTQRMVNGQIGLFQFAVFSGIPMDLYNPPPMTISGRTHINGDFCAGGTSDLVMERVTVSGRLRSGCGGGSMPFIPSGSIATNGFRIVNRANNTPTTIDSTMDSNRADWVTFAQGRWNGNALDQSHAVPFLRLPVATAAAAQPGNNQDGAARTNVDTLRLLVDPPRSGDSTDAAAERLFNKADIRIINGVWYRRDGTILWSDHSGSVNALTEELALGVPAVVSAAPSGPKRYSYYERDATGRTIVDDAATRSIVSYGLLHRVSATDWRPGNLNGTTATELANTDEKRLLGTRTGFLDRRVGLQSGEAAARVLPLNFDVAAFIEALQSTAPGELGAIFGTSFNGIVWIGHTWPGHDTGFTTNPAAGTFAATAPIRAIDADGRHALPPLPLCHNGANATILAGSQQQVDCNAESTIPRVNAVRVHNAHTIDPNVLPRGLTIVTNGPMYLLGDVNTSSLVGTTPGTPRVADPAGTWVPVMIGGDAVTFLSRSWTDRSTGKTDRAFGVTPAGYGGCTADASATTIVAAVLAGHVDSASTWGGGINNFPRFLECWSGVDNRIIGSLVIGYRSVYQRQRYHFFAYRPPNRLWSFDVNFANPTHQPPGTPSFFVQAVERWDRD